MLGLRGRSVKSFCLYRCCVRRSTHQCSSSAHSPCRAVRAARPTSHTTAGLLPWLEQLQQAGVRCAVISNDDVAGIEHFLASHRLERFFSAIWSAEHRPRKPDPAAVHGLCAQLGVPAARCALIGDAN
ncbi:MAG: HAD family hydrolase, partial [Synechococcaceae bacterium WB4_1_0192]|nr:HAD family hydrolase [Synechococcaceae bacterium WB4_1_0192]